MTFNRYAVLISSLALSSCTPAGSVIGTTELELMFNDNAGDITFALKNSEGLENCSPKINTDTGYSTWGGHCYLKGRNIPEQITLEYAEFLPYSEYGQFRGYSKEINGDMQYFSPEGVPYKGRYGGQEEFSAENRRRIQTAMSQIPASAWRTYTFYPKKLLQEYKTKQVQSGSALTSKYNKTLSHELEMQPDGTIKTYTQYFYSSSGEGWRN